MWSLIFCLSFTYSKSEIKSPQFVHYTNEDGLSSSYVKSIAQDKNGFIWLATRASVTRFDGQSFKEFPAYDLEGKRRQIFGDKLYLAMDSLLITRTIDHNYFFFDRYQECFRPYSLLNKIGTVLSVVPSSDGFWICRPNSIGFLDASSGLEMPIDTKFTSVSFAKNIGFNNLIESPDNIVILTNNGKIVVIDKIGDAVKNYSVPREFRTQHASLFLVDSQGNAWLGNAEHGLIRFDLASGHYQLYSERQRMPFYLPHNLVHCITEDQRGNIWIGSEDGLAIFDIETGYLSLHGFDLHNPTGLNSNPIYDAFCDSEGNVWLGTYFGGVNFWSNKDPFFRTWSPGLGDGQLRGNVVSCLTEDSEGNLWIGLEDNGLNKYDFRSGEVIHYSKENGPAALSYNNIHDLLFVSDHELWIATYTGGINVLNPKTNEIRFHTPQNTPGLTSNAESTPITHFS
ncbi:MAG: hypothetical protein LC643_02695 [Bacteroidales bacterium]|nr:hypothetical protein [Bacteroidales bacterium]